MRANDVRLTVSPAAKPIQNLSPGPIAPRGGSGGSGGARYTIAICLELADLLPPPDPLVEAADTEEAAGDIDACCFYLTQAYVFALAGGLPEAGRLHARLLAHGREE